ncbi:zinc ribbon domain-containing protein [Desulfovibrio litoralis]|uniref:Uncharacterized protein n=1 Tax=Desulfovibrio litoralis DSM 11393 TaxID=1121455 RepID=A0A1M7S8G3_9BACT|nr:C4-type zinc ribbon domain-containing protein [Desulfovibrio litoralis]SHN54733.1 hypothetical protein SAMN02745728_00578 [Desulfovibrio litoralis DSM 11393]
MSIYLSQIAQLVALQKVDNEIYDLNKELAKGPLEVEKLRTELETVEKEKKHLEEKLEHIKEQAKRLDIAIDDDGAKLEKSKSKLMQVGSEKEYNAVISELDVLEKNTRGREDEKKMLLDELNHQSTRYAEVNERYESLLAQFNEKSESLQEVVDKCNKRLAVLNEERKHSGCEIPEPVLQRYEFIKGRLEHPVIVFVKEAVCSGCNISVPPQIFIELQKGTQILSCPNCQRLIYWCEHFHRPE